MGWWRCGAAPSKMVKIIIRKPRQNLSWKEFYYNVARCEKCPGCQKLSSRLKWALEEDSLAHLLLHKVESATITPNMGSGGVHVWPHWDGKMLYRANFLSSNCLLLPLFSACEQMMWTRHVTECVHFLPVSGFICCRCSWLQGWDWARIRLELRRNRLKLVIILAGVHGVQYCSHQFWHPFIFFAISLKYLLIIVIVCCFKYNHSLFRHQTRFLNEKNVSLDSFFSEDIMYLEIMEWQ